MARTKCAARPAWDAPDAPPQEDLVVREPSPDELFTREEIMLQKDFMLRMQTFLEAARDAESSAATHAAPKRPAEPLSTTSSSTTLFLRIPPAKRSRTTSPLEPRLSLLSVSDGSTAVASGGDEFPDSSFYHRGTSTGGSSGTHQPGDNEGESEIDEDCPNSDAEYVDRLGASPVSRATSSRGRARGRGRGRGARGGSGGQPSKKRIAKFTMAKPLKEGHAWPCLFKGCNERCSVGRDLRRHMDTHYEERYACPVSTCDVKFRRFDALQRHCTNLKDHPPGKYLKDTECLINPGWEKPFWLADLDNLNEPAPDDPIRAFFREHAGLTGRDYERFC